MPGSKIQAWLLLFAAVLARNARRGRKSRLSADFGNSSLGGFVYDVLFETTQSFRHTTMQSRPKQVPARLHARTAPRAGPRPCRRCAPDSKDAHRFSKVRTLENAGDSFEDAHPFPRCARKLSNFERRQVRSRPSPGSHALSCALNIPRRLRRIDEFVQMGVKTWPQTAIGVLPHDKSFQLGLVVRPTWNAMFVERALRTKSHIVAVSSDRAVDSWCDHPGTRCSFCFFWQRNPTLDPSVQIGQCTRLERDSLALENRMVHAHAQGTVQ